jgi:hypothetical protein
MKEKKTITDKNPFLVPESYFEEVNSKIISATSGNYAGQKRSQLYRKLRPYLGAAASVALLAVLGYYTLISSGKIKPEIQELTINEFTENYINEIDLLTLEEKADPDDYGFSGMKLTRNEIVDYFVLENIDINDIYIQL